MNLCLTVGLKDIEASTLVSAIMVGELVSRLISSILLNDITNETRIFCMVSFKLTVHQAKLICNLKILLVKHFIITSSDTKILLYLNY